MTIKKPVHPVWNGRSLPLQLLSRRKQQTGQSAISFLLFMQCTSGKFLSIFISAASLSRQNEMSPIDIFRSLLPFS